PSVSRRAGSSFFSSFVPAGRLTDDMVGPHRGRRDAIPCPGGRTSSLWTPVETTTEGGQSCRARQALAAPFAIAKVPEKTLQAFADHGQLGELLPPDGGNCEEAGPFHERASTSMLYLCGSSGTELTSSTSPTASCWRISLTGARR